MNFIISPNDITFQNIYFCVGRRLICLIRLFYPDQFERGNLWRVVTPSSILYGYDWQWIVPLPSTHKLNVFTLLFLGYAFSIHSEPTCLRVCLAIYRLFMVIISSTRPEHSILFYCCLYRKRINRPAT
jgi:hypothetical protein